MSGLRNQVNSDAGLIITALIFFFIVLKKIFIEIVWNCFLRNVLLLVPMTILYVWYRDFNIAWRKLCEIFRMHYLEELTEEELKLNN